MSARLESKDGLIGLIKGSMPPPEVLDTALSTFSGQERLPAFLYMRGLCWWCAELAYAVARPESCRDEKSCTRTIIGFHKQQA